MRIFHVLFGHNIARRQKLVWQIQSKRAILPTGTEKILSSLNVTIEDAAIVAGLRKPELPTKETEGVEAALNTTDQETRTAYECNDVYYLQEGLTQAQLLTKTVLVDNALPESIRDTIEKLPEEQHLIVKRLVAGSTIFDGYQTLLPKKKDPARPAWVFPREYGISRERKMSILTRQFVVLCETLSKLEVIMNRNIVEQVPLFIRLVQGPDLLSLSTTVSSMVMSRTLLAPIKDPNESIAEKLPDMHPLHPMLGLLSKPTCDNDYHFPISEKYTWSHPHTIILHHNSDEIKNLTEIPATEHQVKGHTLLRSFIAAACFARQKYGYTTQFPQPVSLQFVQTDGQAFSFGVFQLNTLDFDSTNSIKNYFWLSPKMLLYEQAGYENGRPVMQGYNPSVFETMLAFYRNSGSALGNELR